MAQVVARKYMLLALNEGTTSVPDWKIKGLRVEDSSIDVATDSETITDILGNTFTDINSMELSQPFTGPIINDDDFQANLFDKAMMNDTVGMSGFDALIIKGWNDTMTGPFVAYRKPTCTIEVTRFGGSARTEYEYTVHFGGETVKGTVADLDDITFTPGS